MDILKLKQLRSQIVYGLKWVSRPRPSRFVAAILVLVVGIVIGRTQMPFQVRVLSQDSIPIEGPLKIKFRQDIAASYKPSISPDVPGQWQLKKTPLGVYEAVFTPAKPLQAAQTYILRLSGLKRSITGLALIDQEQRFTTEIAAGIKSITPANNSKDVAVRTKFVVTRSEVFDATKSLTAKLTPDQPLKQVSTERIFTWEPATPLKQGVTYTLQIEDASQPAERRVVISSSFTTVYEPKVVAAVKKDYFTQKDNADIVFDQPMAGGSDLIKFDLPGTGSWVNDRTYRFVPENIKPGQTYTYILKAGLKSKVGGELEADQKFSFATNGAVVATISPGGTVALNTPVRVQFDQPVKRDSAQARFKVTPALSGTYSWSDNTMIFSPTAAAHQTTYSFQLAPGVEPEWGLPSAGVQSASYTTVAQVIKLNVPLYAQGNGRSCELASLRMLLAYRNVYTSESDILGRVGYNPRPRGSTWDNPNVMFVGYVDTYDWNSGYGVHAGPVANAGNSYGLSSSAYFGVSAAFIAENIHAGNPVAVWGYITSPKADSWDTGSGIVSTSTSMHARVVYGVVGSATNPIGFYLNDPWSGGRSYYWSASQLMANMNAVPGVSNQAVVVR